ncbi:LpxI family protein [Tianweitania aestuarii]|nr:UDP-2,3-diacylglucosamine diphosphatase LpxI [Tianweitania aestuarii]
MSDTQPSGLLPPGSRVGIVAGSGSLPVNVAQSLALAGLQPFVVILENEADRLLELKHHQHVVLPIESAAVAFDHMKAAGVTHAVLAGGVARRPRLTALKWTPRVLKVLPRLAIELALGDDGLLRAVMRHIENAGIRVVGAHEVVPDLLARSGAMTLVAPGAEDERNIKAALEAAKAIGRMDIGQAAIAIGGRAVALEGIEGTDGLLERMIPMRNHGRLAGKTGGVLVKCAKPSQDLRADLPAIGPKTVLDAKRAGLRGIAVESNRAFVLDFSQTVAAADEAGLFISGIEVEP